MVLYQISEIDQMIFKSLHDKESLTDMLYKKDLSVGCYPGILYGQTKVHKPIINNFPFLDLYLMQLTHHRIS